MAVQLTLHQAFNHHIHHAWICYCTSVYYGPTGRTFLSASSSNRAYFSSLRNYFRKRIFRGRMWYAVHLKSLNVVVHTRAHIPIAHGTYTVAVLPNCGYSYMHIAILFQNITVNVFVFCRQLIASLFRHARRV